jgi:hypothetical protein
MNFFKWWDIPFGWKVFSNGRRCKQHLLASRISNAKTLKSVLDKHVITKIL